MGRGKGNPSFEQIKLVRDDSYCKRLVKIERKQRAYMRDFEGYTEIRTVHYGTGPLCRTGINFV